MSNFGNIGVTDSLSLGVQAITPVEAVNPIGSNLFGGGGVGLLAGPIFMGQPTPGVFSAAKVVSVVNIVPSPTSVPGGNALNISSDGLGTIAYPGIGLLANAISHTLTCEFVSTIELVSGAIVLTSPTIEFFANEVHVGTVNQAGAKNEIGAKTDTGVRAESSSASQLADLTVSGPVTAVDFYSVATTLNETYAIATKALSLAGKGFDIPHPTKEDHRLRYICLEGPEVGAYIRGTLKDSDTIELPDYWRKLCKSETITVNLTPIGRYQELYVEEGVEWGSKIKVRNASGSSVHCHYTVFAERVTHDKLQVEYKGLTPDDYPGDNSEYAIGGWDYARHKGEPKT